MSNDTGERLHVRAVARGRVQGVGYRAWAQHQAQLQGLDGWVRNRRDGSVEALLIGPAEAVGMVVEALRQGPSGARVDAVEEFPGTPAEEGAEGGSGFSVRPTA